jgi:hypothetical protein
VLATLTAGQSHHIKNLGVDEVVSVQSTTPFAYVITPRRTPLPPPPPEPVLVDAISAYWRCNVSNCSYDDWVGHVVTWPVWAAHHSNARSGFNARTVHSADGKPLYPYMGRWADGCEVTAVAGTVLIIEWKRGTDVWRETFLQPGDTYVINLMGAEDSAMIESPGPGPAFTASLRYCNPVPMVGTDPWR